MTVFDIRQGVRDFFGRLLCLCGRHDWGHQWHSRKLSDRERIGKARTIQYCMRWKCPATQYGPVCDHCSSDREGGGR